MRIIFLFRDLNYSDIARLGVRFFWSLSVEL